MNQSSKRKFHEYPQNAENALHQSIYENLILLADIDLSESQEESTQTSSHAEVKMRLQKLLKR
ncbi:MAG TPA: hypothetical protein VK826_18040 [Bacteroidia bacterium]|nr:hypothetical protein [Bacteroidia bacterium]